MCPIEPSNDPRYDALFNEPGEGPRDVLPRIVEGDPLKLIERCASHLTSEALLLDLERLHARSLALIARRSSEVREEGVSEWLAAQVREAADQLVVEELYEERLGFPPPRAVDPRSEFLVSVLGIEPAMTRGVSVSFHRMDREERRAFWKTVVSGESISEMADDRGETRDHVIEGLRRVIRSLSLSGVGKKDERERGLERDEQEMS
jgi:hypothetical protein